ncbi:MAG: family 1 extracellular solute-binding protein [Haloplasmataceae bacterium]|jgi:ABC-type glycerol-3-phosphate transport system substrate-binding protein|nr:family 1 extracellular solute-binding protein [Haloplasmataceae bacterium]
MFKKTIFMLISVLLVFILVGCNKNKKIQVTIGMWPEPYLTNDVEMFNEWKRLFETDNPRYEIIGQPYTYTVDTFFPMAQSGTQPTVFQTWFTEPQKLIKNGFVKDITENLKALNWYDKMDPTMREALTSNGKVYGVPRDGYGLGLAINLEVFEEVGLIDDWDGDGILDIVNQDGTPRYPTTFDELRETSEFITRTMKDYFDKDVAGLIILSSNNNGGWQFSNLAWNFGAKLQVKNDEGKWVANLNSPEAIEALEWVKLMKWECECLPASASLTYADWYNYLGTGRAAMSFAGSDAISMPITNFGMDKNKIAFVPMPKGPNGHQYSLFGGTPYMFSSRASDEQIEGALKFLEYMGRSPEISEISISSMRLGMRTADQKGMPILPSITPWINEDYLAQVDTMEGQFVNVNLRNFNDFYTTLNTIRKPEEPNYAQEMYEYLDSSIQQVLTNQNANPSALLTSNNNSFQTQYLNNLK